MGEGPAATVLAKPQDGRPDPVFLLEPHRGTCFLDPASLRVQGCQLARYGIREPQASSRSGYLHNAYLEGKPLDGTRPDSNPNFECGPDEAHANICNPRGMDDLVQSGQTCE
jgi:hypothetical protein